MCKSIHLRLCPSLSPSPTLSPSLSLSLRSGIPTTSKKGKAANRRATTKTTRDNQEYARQARIQAPTQHTAIPVNPDV